MSRPHATESPKAPINQDLSTQHHLNKPHDILQYSYADFTHTVSHGTAVLIVFKSLNVELKTSKNTNQSGTSPSRNSNQSKRPTHLYETPSYLLLEDVVDESCLSRAEESRNDGYGGLFLFWDIIDVIVSIRIFVVRITVVLVVIVLFVELLILSVTIDRRAYLFSYPKILAPKTAAHTAPTPFLIVLAHSTTIAGGGGEGFYDVFVFACSRAFSVRRSGKGGQGREVSVAVL